MALVLGGEQTESNAECVRPSAVDLGELVERVLLVRVESNRCRGHIDQCSTIVLHLFGVRKFGGGTRASTRRAAPRSRDLWSATLLSQPTVNDQPDHAEQHPSIAS